MAIRLSFLVSMCILAAAPLQATSLPSPSVEYSADRVIESEAGTFNDKVYAAKDKVRTEASMGGMQSVMITRRDQQLGWLLMPAQKIYQQLDFAQAQARSGATLDSKVEIVSVGHESIAGLTVTRYRMTLQDGSASGFIWITQHGIPVKMDIQTIGKQRTRMTMTLQNLRIGKQDAALFELPAGYTAMSLMSSLRVPNRVSTSTPAGDHSLQLNAALKHALSGSGIR